MSDWDLGNSPEFHRQSIDLAISAALGYGAYSVLAMIAIYVLIRRHGLHKSKARRVLFGFTIAMFLVTTACFIADIRMAILQQGIVTEILPSWKRWAIVNSIAHHIIYVMSDMIVVWRAWVLCSFRSIQVVLSVCIVGSIVGNIVHTANQVEFYENGTRFSVLTSLVVMYLPLALTNLVATSAIAYKAWICRVSIRKHLSQIPPITRAEKVLLLLIESGAGFLAAWLLSVILLVIPGPSTTMVYSNVTEFSLYGMAMYHVVIILLVTGRNAPCETAFQCGTPSSPRFLARDSARSVPTPTFYIGSNGELNEATEMKESSSLSV
ncbi:hypothetical protein C8J56DRAFT_974729 [Mycena floridula]|nr:hypothetical protein C8J56DRAFT_974729 [Mycena floridula]